mgnify:CR=1 FL=1
MDHFGMCREVRFALLKIAALSRSEWLWYEDSTDDQWLSCSGLGFDLQVPHQESNHARIKSPSQTGNVISDKTSQQSGRKPPRLSSADYR